MTEEGDLYVFGKNNRGILGTGRFFTDDQPIPYRISHETVFAGEEVGMLVSSSFYNVVVTKHGSLFTWGTQWGLGHGRRVTDKAPVYIDEQTFEGLPIIMMACGFSSSIALTEGRGVWTCGKGHHAGTYVDDDLYHCIPVQHFHDKKIVKVTSGDYHMMSIDTEDILWAWGDNRYVQLCCGALDEGEGEPQPVLVPPTAFDGSKVAYVAVCSQSTMVVTSDGVLWVQIWNMRAIGDVDNLA